MRETTFDALFPFGGSGGGALGFLDAEARLLGRVGRFRSLGSIDFDREACVDFERFTGTPAWCEDVRNVTAAQLRERYGARAPHVVFLSPPCQGASRLLSSKKSKTAKYVALNNLSITWMRTMLQAWGDSPPALVLLENVAGLPLRAGGMLRELRSMLRAHGYVFHAQLHDAGVLGGLAQHRDRYLLVARHPKKCPSLLYQPPPRRVRGVGEVLDKLPMPATVAARDFGALHELPRLSWKNWLRLALIPAGGDWRDLDGVLHGRARREVFRRHAVQDWKEPMPAVTGPGGHSVEAVADPRVTLGTSSALHENKHTVLDWAQTSKTVIGKSQPSSGAAAVADPRIDALRSNGRDWNNGAYGVRDWAEPSGVVTAGGHPSKGVFSVADPRLGFKRSFVRRGDARPAWYGVLRWDQPSRTIAGTVVVGCGAYSIADHRDRGLLENVRMLTLDEAMALDLDVTKPPPFLPVIVAEDGTWHRPMTLLELAVLQSYPSETRGQRLRFEGGRTLVATHIGNSVPPGAARAIAEQMLVALIEAAEGAMSLRGGDTPVWVTPDSTAVAS